MSSKLLHTDNDGSTLGTRIQEIRKENKLTQAQFGELIGLSQGFVSEMESDKLPPTETCLIAMEYRFSINKQWIAMGNGPKYLKERREVVTPEDPSLMRIIEKVKRIYNTGGDYDRWLLLGLITEILEKYDVPDIKKETAQAAEEKAHKRKRRAVG